MSQLCSVLKTLNIWNLPYFLPYLINCLFNFYSQGCIALQELLPLIAYSSFNFFKFYFTSFQTAFTPVTFLGCLFGLYQLHSLAELPLIVFDGRLRPLGVRDLSPWGSVPINIVQSSISTAPILPTTHFHLKINDYHGV